jgi:dinuclear metal center YbgI/SA1388 family protein
MTLRDIAGIIEEWAPRNIALENDNVGLQVGSANQRVRNILLALEVDRGVIREAKRKSIDLIITHHPLIFQPLQSLDTSEDVANFTHELIQRNISVYSAHTNLDFTRGGVSFALAERLGLQKTDFLLRRNHDMKKISVFVPPEHVEAVARAMAEAGAGIIGDYEKCSFRIEGIGTFQPRKGANPFLGQVGNLERVREVRLEMLVAGWRVPRVLAAMRKAHPYEEVAYDVYRLENEAADVGEGAIGELPRPATLREFLGKIRRNLGIRNLRYSGNPGARIKRVAVCGGSGGSLLPVAMREKADLFVTADVKYHTFHAAAGKIALIDAGHYETEYPVLQAVAHRLRAASTQKGNGVKVMIAKTKTNPIKYY